MNPTSLYDPIAAGCQCHVCPLRNTSPIIPPEGPVNKAPKVVIIGDAPGPRDIEAGRPFFGAGGVKLSQYLTKLKITRSEAFLTHAVLCRTKVPDLEGARAWQPKTYAAWFKRENVARRKAGAEILVNPFEACAPRLYRELTAADQHAKAEGAPNGIVVMPVENFAMGSVFGVPGSSLPVLKYRGSVIQESDFAQMQLLLRRGKTK